MKIIEYFVNSIKKMYFEKSYQNAFKKEDYETSISDLENLLELENNELEKTRLYVNLSLNNLRLKRYIHVQRYAQKAKESKVTEKRLTILVDRLLKLSERKIHSQ